MRGSVSPNGTGRSQRNSVIAPLSGVTVENLDWQTRRQLNLPPQLHGVVVIEVDPVSPASIAGLRAADVILEIERQPASDTDDAIETSRRISSQHVLLRVWSNGESHYVIINGTKHS